MKELRELTNILSRATLGGGNEGAIKSLIGQIERYEEMLSAVDIEVKNLVAMLNSTLAHFGKRTKWRTGVSIQAMERVADRLNAKYKGV